MTQVARPEQIAIEDWKLRALDLRREGKNFRTIAAIMGAEGGPGSTSRAHELVIQALADLRADCREAAGDVRDLELQRLDSIIEKLWPKRDRARVVDTILRAMDRRAKYLGLDAPKRIEATGAGGSPLLPPGSVVVQLVQPGEPIPATNPAIDATDTGPDATKPEFDATESLTDET